MLSDEEKKAINHLTEKMKYHKDNPLGTYVWLTLDEHYVRTILNLIKKQSKEIEEAEQKERKAYIKGTNDADELCNKKWKDKIKEICQKKRNQIFSCSYVDEKQWKPFDRAIDAINDLEQSLLEKE